MLTRCPHCGAWALVVKTVRMGLYDRGRLRWRRIICGRLHWCGTAGWE